MNKVTLTAEVSPEFEHTMDRWRQQIGAAVLAWGQLTEAELMKLEGQGAKLIALIQERYALSKEDADKQVKAIFAKHASCSCCK